ncbi:MAG: hypothetical protein ACRBDI_07430 [Alphaproteobacteria bacterium]
MKAIKETALAMMLSAAAQGVGAQGHNHDHDHDAHAQNNTGVEFQLPIVKGGAKVVPVDCDLLDQNGRVTPEFVKRMGVESHFARIDHLIEMKERQTSVEVSDKERLKQYIDHIGAHGLTRERIEIGAQHCRDKYMEP